MSSDGLLQTDDLTAAEWIAPRLGAFGSGVHGVIPAGFEAYARILHPARSSADGHVGWAAVAAAYGKVAHPLMQFHALVGATSTTDDVKTGPWQGSPPSAGDLEPESLAALLDVLAGHTDAPQECWFAVWEGWGWTTGGVSTISFAQLDDHPAAPTVVPDTVHEAQPAPFVAEPATTDSALPDHWARVELPSRKYVLFGGPLDAALEVGYWPTPNWFLPQSPSIFWSDDVSWCVATEIDLFCTYVGGSRALIDDLLADERLEVWEAHLDDPVAHDSDVLNS
jgi:hypothetical protein